MNLPITIQASAAPATMAAAARVLFNASVAFALGKGWIRADDVQGLAAIAAAVFSMLWGVDKSRRRHRELVTTARHVPDSIAQVKETK